MTTLKYAQNIRKNIGGFLIVQKLNFFAILNDISVVRSLTSAKK